MSIEGCNIPCRMPECREGCRIKRQRERGWRDPSVARVVPPPRPHKPPHKPVQPAPVPPAPSTHETPHTALDGDMAAVDEACERLSATCDGIEDVLTRLRNRDWRNSMMEDHDWTDLERLHGEVAAEIERLRRIERLRVIETTARELIGRLGEPPREGEDEAWRKLAGALK
jgi:hypothetical protein